MKRLLPYILPLCLLALDLGAQSLNSPESILWDDQTNKFLISNAADGKIQWVNDQGNITTFSKESKGSHGLCFYGRYSVISCYKDEIYITDRLTGSLIRKHKIPGALFLNGVCSDGNSLIYVTDFSRRKVFRIENPELEKCQVTEWSTMDKVPNGIAYDKRSQQLVILTWGTRASILHISSLSGKLEKSSATAFNNLEGIVSDGQGGYFVTSWVPGGLFHYNGMALEQLMDQKVEQATGLTMKGDGALFVMSSQDKRFRNSPFKVDGFKKEEEEMLLTAFPNPMSINSLITYELPEAGAVNISVYDCQGNLIEDLVTERKIAGKHQFFYDRGNKSSGLYFINIQTSAGNKAIAVTLVD